MHWTEILALVIIVAALVPVVVILGNLCAFAWSALSYRAELQRIDLGREYPCEQGLFVRKEHGWGSEIDVDGTRIQLDVRDNHGSPDSAFLRRLPEIVTKLAILDRRARGDVQEVTDDYVLESVLSPARPDDDYEFALGFFPQDEEGDEMSIYVNFRGDQVVGWLGVD